MADPKITGKAPIVIDMEAGDYAWCGCGLSENEPFCDGKHRGTEYEGQKNCPMPVSISEEDEGKKPWCNCKHTKTPPYCDGSHTKL